MQGNESQLIFFHIKYSPFFKHQKTNKEPINHHYLIDEIKDLSFPVALHCFAGFVFFLDEVHSCPMEKVRASTFLMDMCGLSSVAFSIYQNEGPVICLEE